VNDRTDILGEKEDEEETDECRGIEGTAGTRKRKPERE